MPEEICPDKNLVGDDGPPAGSYIGFDYGLKRIGLATGNSATVSAMPLETIANRNGTPDWQRLDAIVNEWQPSAMVVGKPLQLDGTEQEVTHHAMGFRRRLVGRYAVPVFTADERYSSIEAESLLKRTRQLKARSTLATGDVDKIAATHILQSWLVAHFPA